MATTAPHIDTERNESGLRAAVEVILSLAHEGPSALWEEGDGQAATAAIINRLRGRALELDVVADTATACPGCGLIDPNGVHDGTCEVAADEQLPPFAPSDVPVWRAEHDSIVMGLYTTPAAARAHCEAEERRSWPTGTNLAFDWIEDEEDGFAELTVHAGQNEESVTGYLVTALTVAAAYDAEAAERQTA